MERAVILCDGDFGQSTGKTANGLVRYSKRYEIAGVIDHTKAGRDAGDVLDGKPNGVPIVANLKEAIERCQPETLIIGVATFGGYIPKEFRPVIREAIEHRLNVVAGLHEFLNDDPEFVKLAEAHGARLVDVRKPRPIRESKQFSDLVRAYDETRARVIVVEGQGSISHPAYVCGTRAIIMASMPSAILMMHAPARKTRSFRRDIVAWPMPTADEEIEWLQFYTRRIGGGKVVGIGINHENMTRDEVEAVVGTFEQKYGIPTADPLWHGCGKFVAAIQRMT